MIAHLNIVDFISCHITNHLHTKLKYLNITAIPEKKIQSDTNNAKYRLNMNKRLHTPVRK